MAASEPVTSGLPWPNRGYAWYVVVVLMIAFSFAIVDRVAMGLLVQPIEHDLGIGDAQIGLLSGLAFGIFYATLVFPIGVLADRTSRRWIVTLGILVWSLATMACGLSVGFFSLFLARIGIGAGEATINPAGTPLIADYFPPEVRPRAFAVFVLGSSIGSGLSYAIGGSIVDVAQRLHDTGPLWLQTIAAWKIVFFLIGVPGLLIAPLFYFTVREPARRESLAVAGKSAPGQLSRALKENWVAYTTLSLAASLNLLSIYVLLAWIPTLYIRYHHWSPSEIGRALGTYGTPAGLFSCVTGGLVISWFERRGRNDSVMLTLAIATFFFSIGGIGAAVSSSANLGIAFYALMGLFATWASVCAFTGLNQITSNELRSKVIALYTLCYGILGLGAGPYSVGLLSDNVFHGPRGIGWSIAAVLLAVGVAGLCLLLIGRKPFEQGAKTRRSMGRTPVTFPKEPLMSFAYAALLVVHVFLFVYWLGSDLGVFYSAGYMARPDLTPATRAAILKILMWLDLWPRMALILMIPVGSTLALWSGYAVLPGDLRQIVPPILWIVALIWLAMAVRIHTKHTKSLVPYDMTLRIAVIIGFIVLAIASLTGHGPAVPGAAWLGAKFGVYAYIILCGLGIRLTFRPFGPAFAALMKSGSTPEIEADIRRAIVNARVPALALWTGVAAEAILGLTKPF